MDILNTLDNIANELKDNSLVLDNLEKNLAETREKIVTLEDSARELEDEIKKLKAPAIPAELKTGVCIKTSRGRFIKIDELSSIADDEDEDYCYIEIYGFGCFINEDDINISNHLKACLKVNDEQIFGDTYEVITEEEFSNTIAEVIKSISNPLILKLLK